MNKSLILFALIICFACCKKSKQQAIEKTVPVKKMIDAYTEVQWGNMPLIISVPHGGTVSPADIPDRACPGITTAVDINTIEMLKAIDSICYATYQLKPYYVFTNLKRIKIDENRELAEATCSNATVAGYWYNYHNSLDTCINMAGSKYGQCIFIDLHGHGHTKQRLELGYLISAAQLRNPATISASSSSVYNLFAKKPSLVIQDLLAGPASFGTLMANKNFPAVPSLQDAAPLAADLYFDGGYNTQRYCSNAYPAAAGWQIETNYSDVRDNKTSRDNFARAFLQSMMEYFSTNTTLNPAEFGK